MEDLSSLSDQIRTIFDYAEEDFDNDELMMVIYFVQITNRISDGNQLLDIICKNIQEKKKD